MPSPAVVIVAAKRTPIGSFNGALASLTAAELGACAIASILAETGIAPDRIDDVILGQVLTAANGQNPARQAALRAGIPDTKTALTINQVCGSGLRAVAMGMQSVMAGDSHAIIAGGQESMSQSPHAAQMRNGTKMGPLSLVDTMIHDGLWDAFNAYHMGITAENIAERFGISRADQDQFALQSQNRAEAAQNDGRFENEIVPVSVASRKETIQVARDEYPRAGTTIDSLSKLKPAFKPDGTVTAGNASGINDGAAALLIMTEAMAANHNLTPLVRIASWATAGVDPAIMGTGPIPASRKALDRAGWRVQDLDLIEANEAFAAQALCVARDMDFDPAITNVNGGAIALGHPIGASGARILVTLVHEMRRRHAKKGLATLCIGGGMGIAMTLETL